MGKSRKRKLYCAQVYENANIKYMYVSIFEGVRCIATARFLSKSFYNTIYSHLFFDKIILEYIVQR